MEFTKDPMKTAMIAGAVITATILGTRKLMCQRKIAPSSIPGMTPRPVGALELPAVWGNAMTDGQMSNAFHIISKQKLTLATVKTAFTTVANTQAFMRSRMCPLENDGKLWFVPMEEGGEYDIKEKPEKAWEQEVEEQLSIQYNEKTGPLWRVVFLPNATHGKASGDFCHESVIVLGCHHAIIDGVSLMRLIAQVTTAINKLLDGESLIDLPIYDFGPPLDKAINRKGIKERTFWGFVKATTWVISLLPDWMFASRIKSVVAGGGNLFYQRYGLPMNKDNTVPAQTAIVPLELSMEAATALLQACRKNGATIQGAAMAAVNVAMEKFILEGTDTKEVTYPTMVMANARQFLNVTIPQNALGNYPSAFFIPTVLKCNQQTSFWQNAKHCSLTVKGLVNREEAVKSATIFYVMANVVLKGMLRQGEKHPKGGDMMNVFSNVGNCMFVNEHATSVKVVSRHGAVGGNIMAPSPFRHYLTSVDGRLCWTLVYSRRFVSPKHAATLGVAILDALKTATA